MKLIVAILAMLLVGAGFYMFDWSDKWERKKTAQGLLDAKKTELTQLQDAIKELPILEEKIRQKEADLHAVVQGSVTDENPDLFVANYIREVEELVNKQQAATGDDSFIIRTITPGGAEKTGAPAAAGAPAPEAAPTPEALQAFQTRVFQMNLDGRYGTIVDFLYQLGAMKLDRLVTINRISLSRGGSGDSKSPSTSPVLTVDIPITAYLRTGTN